MIGCTCGALFWRTPHVITTYPNFHKDPSNRINTVLQDLEPTCQSGISCQDEKSADAYTNLCKSLGTGA